MGTPVPNERVLDQHSLLEPEKCMYHLCNLQSLSTAP